jgi:thiamine-phosphate pyrophosphorylase
MRSRIGEIFQTDIYGITCEALTPSKDNLETVRQLINAGVKIIQYREKEKSRRDKYEECRVIREMCKPAKVLFIVYDDVDIAILSQAGGVHVGQQGLPADAVRKLTGPEMVIGVSAAGTKEVEDAIARGADYVAVGPVFPAGLDLLRWVSEQYKIPLVAMGGIDEDNIGEVRRCGVSCSAMDAPLIGHNDVASRVRLIRQKISEAGV